jgi:hypothetical protein
MAITDGLDAVAKGDGPDGSIARLSAELVALEKAADESGPGGRAALADARRQLEEEYLAQVSPSAAHARQEGLSLDPPNSCVNSVGRP